jgi:hypothetical protein
MKTIFALFATLLLAGCIVTGGEPKSKTWAPGDLVQVAIACKTVADADALFDVAVVDAHRKPPKGLVCQRMRPNVVVKIHSFLRVENDSDGDEMVMFYATGPTGTVIPAVFMAWPSIQKKVDPSQVNGLNV